MKKRFAIPALCLTAALAAGMLTGCARKEESTSLLSPKDPVAITVWTYYNGAQLTAFNEMVDEFNATRGKELGITVTGYSHGSVADLQQNVLDAVNGKVGAEEVPNIFAAYADNAFAIDQLGMVVDLAPYFTEERRARYIDSYITEGDFDGTGTVKIFPTAKSTELFVLNNTDWQKFAEATGAQYEDMSTVEGLVETSRLYYEWTDSLTETPNDGKAFYGRDAMANYMLIGAMQLGNEIFSVQDGKVVIDLDHDVARKLWDNYYVPYVRGWFAATGRFRSDDVKTGNILAFTGSSSSVTFFPKTVATDTDEYDIEMQILTAPQFSGSIGCAVQQGAGMVVSKKSEKEIEASVEFLFWFTEDDRNISFSVNSGYMPVTKAANDMDAIRKQTPDLDPVMDTILSRAVETVNNNVMYTSKAFQGGGSARSVLDNSMADKAAADREAVLTAVAAGSTMDEALSPYLTDDNFEAWYQSTVEQLNAYQS